MKSIFGRQQKQKFWANCTGRNCVSRCQEAQRCKVQIYFETTSSQAQTHTVCSVSHATQLPAGGNIFHSRAAGQLQWGSLASKPKPGSHTVPGSKSFTCPRTSEYPSCNGRGLVCIFKINVIIFEKVLKTEDVKYHHSYTVFIIYLYAYSFPYICPFSHSCDTIFSLKIINFLNYNEALSFKVNKNSEKQLFFHHRRLITYLYFFF